MEEPSNMRSMPYKYAFEFLHKTIISLLDKIEMKRKIYLLFLTLAVSSLLTIFLIARIKDNHEAFAKEVPPR